jgi:hypothetical protein
MHVGHASTERCWLVLLVVAILSLLTVASAPAAELLVSSQFTNQGLRYDGTTGTPLGPFVTAGSGGLSVPQCLLFKGGPPACGLTATLPGPPTTLVITTQAAFGSGLGSIALVQGTNVLFLQDPFIPCPPMPLVVTATKLDERQSAQVMLNVTDMAGNLTTCAPVVTDVVGTGGQPIIQTFPDMLPKEDQVIIANGRPGLWSLRVVVNGRRFRATGLVDNEVRELDIASALGPGANTITLIGNGSPGSRASVLIWDGKTTEGGKTRRRGGGRPR